MTAMSPFTIDSAIAPLAVTTAHGAVTRIDLNKLGSRAPESAFERHVASELEEYFAGTRTDFTFPTAAEGTPFEKRVWRELLRIPYGATTTYGEIARKLGKPNASRAVGAANGKNPIPIVVPCHRVVAAGGKLGGYGGGLDLKRRLLSLEAANSGMHAIMEP